VFGVLAFGVLRLKFNVWCLTFGSGFHDRFSALCFFAFNVYVSFPASVTIWEKFVICIPLQ